MLKYFATQPSRECSCRYSPTTSKRGKKRGNSHESSNTSEHEQALPLEDSCEKIYLDFTLVTLSTTFTTKLPPVRAHPAYHSLSRPSPAGAPLRCAALTGSGA